MSYGTHEEDITSSQKIRLYSISFVGARGLEVVGGCFVATLDVQQLYRLFVVFHFGRWELAIYVFGRWILLWDGFGARVGCCRKIGPGHMTWLLLRYDFLVCLLVFTVACQYTCMLLVMGVEATLWGNCE